MSQAVIAKALLYPAAAVPSGITDPEGRLALKRFSVYRNNVASSLTRALEAAFPTVRKLVGDEFFSAMAGVYFRAHPPRSPMLMLYGGTLPRFLETFQPVAHLGYLPDIARLDQAMRESYHSADSSPLSEDQFQRLLGEDISALRLTLSPSLRLIRSRWPIHAIWRANAEGGPAPIPGPEHALILRPEFDPRPHRLDPGAGDFIMGLISGRTLGVCVDLAGPDLDLPTLLGLLISGRAIIGASE
jgi:Putative DNA-binding domain